MIILNNGVLRIEIAEPGEHPNDRARFDRAGFITEVILNNELRFCANENRNNIHPTSVAFWATDHLFSPEFIQTIRIKPGESYSWCRKMTFADEG